MKLMVPFGSLSVGEADSVYKLSRSARKSRGPIAFWDIDLKISVAAAPSEDL
jgi:hypothetical protein